MNEPVNTARNKAEKLLHEVFQAYFFNEEISGPLSELTARVLDEGDLLIDPELLEAINRRQKTDRAERVMESLLVEELEADFLGDELPVTFDTEGREVELDYIAREGYVTYTRTVSPWKKTHHMAEDR